MQRYPDELTITPHYNNVIMGAIASQITSLATVFSTVYSDADQSKYQSSASLAIVRGIHWSPVNSPHKGPVTRKMFPFDDVIMLCRFRGYHCTVMSYGHHGVEITGNSTVCLFFVFMQIVDWAYLFLVLISIRHLLLLFYVFAERSEGQIELCLKLGGVLQLATLNASVQGSFARMW